MQIPVESSVNTLIQLDNGYLACGTFKGTIQIWNLDNIETPELTLTGHDEGVCRLIQWSSNRLISASEDFTIKIWNLTTGECMETLTGHTDAVSCISALESVGEGEEGRIVSGSHDNTVKVWKLTNPEGFCEKTLLGHEGPIYDIKSTSDDSESGLEWIAVSASEDKTIRVWNVETSECLGVLTGHDGGVECMVFSSLRSFDQLILISASHDKTIKLWNLTTMSCIETIVTGHRDIIGCMVKLRNNNHLLESSFDRTLKLYDLSPSDSAVCLKTFPYGHKDIVTCLVELQDGRIASGSFDKTIRIWELGYSGLSSDLRR